MKSKCIEEGTLRAYQDGALSPSESKAVEEHLQECAMCRLNLSEQQLATSQTSSLLNTYLLVPAPALDAAFERTIAGLPAVSAARAAAGRAASRQQVGAMMPEAATSRGSDAARRVDAWKPRRSWLAMAGVGVAFAVLLAFVLPGFLATRSVSLVNIASADMTPVSVSHPSDKEFTSFVPAGKVRHMVIEYTREISGSQMPSLVGTEDVWLGNGQEHLLMRREMGLDVSMGGRTSLLLINNEAAWYYDSAMLMYDTQGHMVRRDLSDTTVVYRMDYSPDFLVPYAPDEALIANLLQQPNIHIIATGTLNGRPYKLVESVGNSTNALRADRLLTMNTWSTMPIVRIHKLLAAWGISVIKMEPVPPGVQATPQALMTPIVTVLRGNTRPGNMSYYLWVDSETSRLLQIQFKTPISSLDNNSTTGTYEIVTLNIKTDELLDAGQVAPDLFTFSAPADREIVQAMSIFSMPSPKEEYKGEESSWDVYRSPDGDFMAVVPGGETSDSESAGWHLHTRVLSEPPVTFTVAYHDLVLPVNVALGPEADNARLEAMLTSLVTRMQGTVKSSGPATLHGHVGKEVTIRDASNMYTRLRLFVVGQRFYAIYASAPDEGVLNFASLNSTAYFTRYDVGVGTFLNSLTLLGR